MSYMCTIQIIYVVDFECDSITHFMRKLWNLNHFCAPLEEVHEIWKVWAIASARRKISYKVVQRIDCQYGSFQRKAYRLFYQKLRSALHLRHFISDIPVTVLIAFSPDFVKFTVWEAQIAQRKMDTPKATWYTVTNRFMRKKTIVSIILRIATRMNFKLCGIGSESKTRETKGMGNSK